MNSKGITFAEQDGWEPTKRPRCKSCGGETAQVFVSYAGGKPKLEWECMLCSKPFRENSGKYKHKYNKRR